MTVITKFKAIHNLVGGQMSWDGDVTYHDGQTPPTEEEINTELASMQTEHDSQEYARNRKSDYPSMEECLHAILDDDLTALQAKRQAVKDKYPKG